MNLRRSLRPQTVEYYSRSVPGDVADGTICVQVSVRRGAGTQSLRKIGDSVPAEGLLMIEVSGRIAISRKSRVGSGTVVSSQERKPQALVSAWSFRIAMLTRKAHNAFHADDNRQPFIRPKDRTKVGILLQNSRAPGSPVQTIL